MRSLIGLSLVLLTACGGTPEPTPVPEPAAEPAPAPKAEAPAKEKKADEKVRVFFKSPADGAKVKSPVKLEFGVEGMEVKAAGDVVEGTGHHHLIIGPKGIKKGVQVPADETHIHYGKGQTTAEVPLAPGDYELTMQFADGTHLSYGEVLAATISITVEE